VPGHAQAAIALLNEETGDFIAGDQLLPNISSNPLIEPQLNAKTGKEAVRTDSLIQYRDNLKTLTQLPIRKVFPGHGEPFTEVNELIEERLNEQSRRRDRLFDLLGDMDGCSAYDLASAYFPNHHDQGQLILSETLGFLDWMEDEGIIVSKRDENGVYRWRISGKD
jgi:glyoxylase-like metal-dependent hydrolase (beta-lactamase superfamily II)